MTSRLKLAAPAIRPALPARAVFSGPPGAGKTRTALIVATVLAEGRPILFIDTEQESALTYADDFEFVHLPFRPPYDPRDLAATLVEAGDQYAVIVVDSLSHFWRAEGGVLDIAGGKFSNWKDARPIHETMVQAFLSCKAHFIGCARAKTEHVQETDPRSGKQVVRKIGMAVIQDDTLEYELNVACELDMDHSFVVSKSRTVAVPVGRVFKAEQAEMFAEEYRDWLQGGEPPAPAEFVAALRDRIGALSPAVRKECKVAFMASLGRPDTLPESRMDAASSLVAGFESRAAEIVTEEEVTVTEQHAATQTTPPGDSTAPDREVPVAPPTVEPAPAVGEVGSAPPGGSPPPGGKNVVARDDHLGAVTANVTGGEGSPHESDGAGTGTSSEPTPTPSGDAPAPLKDINARAYQQLNRKCRAIHAEHGDPDKDTAASQWEALAWACSGARTTHLGELSPDEAAVFRTRMVDVSEGRAVWAETSDSQWLGWTLTYGEETAA